MWQDIKKDGILQYKLRVRDRNRRSTITTASLNTINEDQEYELNRSGTTVNAS